MMLYSGLCMRQVDNKEVYIADRIVLMWVCR